MGREDMGVWNPTDGVIRVPGSVKGRRAAVMEAEFAEA